MRLARTLSLAMLLAVFATPAFGQVVIRAVQAAGEGGEIQTTESFSFAPLSALDGGLMFGSGGVMMSSDPLNMLQMQQFADELTILDEQQSELRALASEVRKMRSDVFSKLRKPDGRLDVNNLQEQMRAVQEAIKLKTEDGLKRILLPAQRDRLDEIRTQMSLQQGGINALRGNRLAELIGLTEDQRKELTDKQGDYQKRLQKGIEELKRKLQEQILAEVLTKDQMKKLTDLQGEKFEVKRPSFREQIEAFRKKSAEPAEDKKKD